MHCGQGKDCPVPHYRGGTITRIRHLGPADLLPEDNLWALETLATLLRLIFGYLSPAAAFKMGRCRIIHTFVMACTL